MNLDYWNSYYQQTGIQEPSNFAQYILSTQQFSSIIDFGCGNGRDSIYFATAYKKVLACDFSVSALNSFYSNGLNLYSKNVDFSSIEPRRFYRDINEYDMGYARFFLCAISENGRQNFYKCARYSIKQNGKLLIECRSDKGIKPDETHQRNLINKDLLIKELEDNLFKIELIEEDKGFSPMKKEDPVLIRCVAINTSCQKYSDGCPKKKIYSCCTDKLRDMLFDVVDLLEQEKIWYWVDFGTLLGAVRHKDIIPWDQDVDISTFEENKDKIRKLEGPLTELGYKVINNQFACKIYPSIYNNKVWLDIYYWRKDKSGNLHNVISGFNSKIKTFPQNIIGNLSKVTLNNREFNAPEKHLDKLTRMYGKWEVVNRKVPYWG